MPNSSKNTPVDLPVHMLNNPEIPHAWKIGYISSFFIEPFYRELSHILDITRAQYVILFCLQHSPGASAQDVVETTGRPKNSISVAVTKLEKKGYLTRSPLPEDPRVLQMKLTPKGVHTYHGILELLQAREAAMLAPLSPAERVTLDRLLMKVARHAPAWSYVDQKGIASLSDC